MQKPHAYAKRDSPLFTASALHYISTAQIDKMLLACYISEISHDADS
jgi:hypothetical protein